MEIRPDSTDDEVVAATRGFDTVTEMRAYYGVVGYPGDEMREKTEDADRARNLRAMEIRSAL
jgi:hypothetical protein